MREQGDYPTARAMFDDILTRSRRLLGEDHPDTLTAAHELARVVQAQASR